MQKQSALPVSNYEFHVEMRFPKQNRRRQMHRCTLEMQFRIKSKVELPRTGSKCACFLAESRQISGQVMCCLLWAVSVVGKFICIKKNSKQFTLAPGTRAVIHHRNVEVSLISRTHCHCSFFAFSRSHEDWTVWYVCDSRFFVASQCLSSRMSMDDNNW